MTSLIIVDTFIFRWTFQVLFDPTDLVEATSACIVTKASEVFYLHFQCGMTYVFTSNQIVAFFKFGTGSLHRISPQTWSKPSCPARNM